MNHSATPFYEKFTKPKTIKKSKQASGNRSMPPAGKTATEVGDPFQKDRPRYAAKPKHRLSPLFGEPVFTPLEPQAKKIVDHFPVLLHKVLHLDSKKKAKLPQHIRELFHELTDERSKRTTQYLSNPVKLSAYMHYYLWWNLVRMVKLLQTMPILLEDGSVAVDLGSGPLTLLCALWIAKPELRAKKLVWYCVDISHKALTLGEELFLALCAYTAQETGDAHTPWIIKKVTGTFGTPIKEKALLVTEANMFNEIFWDNLLPIDEVAEKAHRTILQYLAPQGSVLLIEPGIPLAGTFMSCIRTCFTESGFSIEAPCPHAETCPLPNRKPLERSATYKPAAYGKWCHFTFETHDSPKELLRLSEAANLGKERASLSFLYCTSRQPPRSTQPTAVRICSDIIRLEDGRIGRYACAARGFMLLSCGNYPDAPLKRAVSGSMLILPPSSSAAREFDKKTGALLIRLD